MFWLLPKLKAEEIILIATIFFAAFLDYFFFRYGQMDSSLGFGGMGILIMLLGINVFHVIGLILLFRNSFVGFALVFTANLYRFFFLAESVRFHVKGLESGETLITYIVYFAWIVVFIFIFVLAFLLRKKHKLQTAHTPKD